MRRELAWWTTVIAAVVLAVAVERGATAEKPKQQDPRAYAGNVETHKFHQRSCRYYTCRNCTAYFATREEAIEAGYRPCGVCDP